MSFHSHTRLTTNNEEDLMEKAEEDDAEAEEKAEQELGKSRYAELHLDDEDLDEYDEGSWGRRCQIMKHQVKDCASAFFKFIRYDVWTSLTSIFLVSGFSLINRRSARSDASVVHERFRQTAYPYVIHPFSLFRWLWDVGIIISCTLHLTFDPLRASFYRSDYKEYDQWTQYFDSSTVLFLDVLLNFRTGLVQDKTDIVTLDGVKIFKCYVKGWFVIDLISSFPLDGLYLAMVNDDKLDPDDKDANDVARIAVITRLLLIFRLIRYLQRIEMGIRLNGLEIRLINQLVAMVVFIHWLACAHYLIPELFNEDEAHRKENSWLSKMNLWSAGVYERYVNCLLRALTHFSLIGFGLDTPNEIEEIYLSIANIVIGIGFMATLLAYVITLLMSLDVSERRFIEVTKQAGEYMRFKQIPKSLQKRVEAYYEQRYRHNYYSEEAILESVSNALRRELQMHSCATLVEEVPLFHKINRSILQEIVARLEFEVYLPNDVIIWANTVGDAMYFIEHGSVSILTTEGRPICSLHDGDFFGEMSMVFNEPRASTVIATSYCDIYRLTKLDFVEVIQPYPQIYESIVKVAEARAARLDKLKLYKHVKASDAATESKTNLTKRE